MHDHTSDQTRLSNFRKPGTLISNRRTFWDRLFSSLLSLPLVSSSLVTGLYDLRRWVREPGFYEVDPERELIPPMTRGQIETHAWGDLM